MKRLRLPLILLSAIVRSISVGNAGYVCQPQPHGSCCQSSTCITNNPSLPDCQTIIDYIASISTHTSYFPNTAVDCPNGTNNTCEVKGEWCQYDGSGPTNHITNLPEFTNSNGSASSFGNPANNKRTASCSVSQPVNVNNGAMWHEYVDFTINGLTEATSFPFKRTYLSRNPQTGAFGGGNWWFSVRTRLKKVGPGVTVSPLTVPLYSIVWIDPDGGPWRFERQNDGSLTAPPGLEGSTLTEFEDRYELKLHAKAVYTFSKTGPEPEGYIRSIKSLYPIQSTLSFNYSPNGGLESLTEPNGETVTLEWIRPTLYGPYHLKVTRSSANQVYAYYYDSDGKLTSSKDSLGKETLYSYYDDSPQTGRSRQLYKIIDPIGREIKYHYQSSGEIMKTVEPGGAEYHFSIWSTATPHPYTDVIGPDTKTIRYTHDTDGQLLEILYPDASKKKYEWNSAHRISAEIDELNYRTEYTYDIYGNVTSVKLPEDQTPTTLTYDPDTGKPLSFTPKSEASTTLTVDPTTGEVASLSRSDSLGAITVQKTYNPSTSGVSVNVNNGIGYASHSFTPKWQPTSLAHANGGISVTYNSRGLVDQIYGSTTLSYTYDLMDRVTQITDSDGPTVTMTYDDVGRLLTRTVHEIGGSGTQTTTYTWDDRDRLTSVTDSNSKTTTFEYNHIPFGCGIRDVPTKITDPAGRETNFEYDLRWRLTKVTDPENGITQYEYNARGDRTAVVDPEGNRTEFFYDGNRRLIRRERATVVGSSTSGSHTAGVEITRYKYDADGKLLREEQWGTSTTQVEVTKLVYDELGRLKEKIQRREDAQGNVLKTYDNSTYKYARQIDGESLLEAQNATSKLTFTQPSIAPFMPSSAQHEALQSGNPWGLIEETLSIQRHTSGKITGVTTSVGTSFSLYLSRDATGRINVAMGYAPTSYAAENISFDGYKRPSQIDFWLSQQLHGTFAHDILNRTTQVTWTGSDQVDPNPKAFVEDLTYNATKGHVSSIGRGTDYGSFAFGYDDLDQLLTANFTPGANPPTLGSLVANRTLAYDANGNRSTDSTLTGTATIAANALTSTSAYEYWHDPLGLGRVTKRKSKSSDVLEEWTHRPDGKVTKYLKFEDSNQNGTWNSPEVILMEAEYAYDALGRRIAKKVTPQGQSTFTQSYLHIGEEDRIFKARSGNGDEYFYLSGDNNQHFGHIKRDTGGTERYSSTSPTI